MINLNITSATIMIKIVLPILLAKKKGAIINLSSVTSLMPFPLLSTFSASKAYLDFLSRILQNEYSSQGIAIQTLYPAGTYTGMLSNTFKDVKPGIFIPQTDQYVANAIKTLGFSSSTTGYWPHSLQVLFTEKFMKPCIVKLMLMKHRKNAMDENK